ncbi:hypothetical protein FJT64_007081 [Amphibalanus amphitrite]|uniref:Uncharacterized protein n=1 Tax=Amphibalanus amphitrite TaxID=1232801 RepID=A0A6A4VG50_AMPAM|nr:hypothetical protein FJT64_007081 [Amphibalanus amphitrite]
MFVCWEPTALLPVRCYSAFGRHSVCNERSSVGARTLAVLLTVCYFPNYHSSGSVTLPDSGAALGSTSEPRSPNVCGCLVRRKNRGVHPRTRAAHWKLDTLELVSLRACTKFYLM